MLYFLRNELWWLSLSGHKFIKRFRAPDSHIPVSQKIHFYKINSRYGLKYLPIHGHELNIGVEHGPDAVLSQQFLKELAELPHLHSYDFPLPEDVEDEKYFAEFAKHSRECADLITKTLEPGETQVVVGGVHSVITPWLLRSTNQVSEQELFPVPGIMDYSR